MRLSLALTIEILMLIAYDETVCSVNVQANQIVLQFSRDHDVPFRLRLKALKLEK